MATNQDRKLLGTALLIAGTAGALALATSRRRNYSFDRRVVLITGGSRGLGLALAEDFRREGAHLLICARDERELQSAAHLLHERVSSPRDILTVVCDVTRRDQVSSMVEQAIRHFGQIDVLVNSAGIIQVGPVEAQTIEDFEEAMAINFWGTVYTTLTVLPHMRARRAGRIANITSIGGRMAMPHLLPYTCSKFAVVGFSLGLRSEIAKDGVFVTTVIPGLMRTGSYQNATFKGENRREYSWFALSSSLPGLTMSAERAARSIIDAVREGKAEATLGLSANIAETLFSLFPGLGAEVLRVMNRLLPDSQNENARRRGRQSRTVISESPLTTLGKSAARRYNQNSIA